MKEYSKANVEELFLTNLSAFKIQTVDGSIVF